MQMSALGGYSSVSSRNGNGRVGVLHQEKLPSDLDGVLIEYLDCDTESIIRNDLMDRDAQLELPWSRESLYSFVVL